MLFEASLLLLVASNVNAFWRMQCFEPIVTDMIDPIVQPGVIPAKHIHNIMGGSGFSSTADQADLQKSECTSCRLLADKSAYWVPTLYFKPTNGDLVQVQQKQDMLVYYLPQRGIDVQPFPEGFRMLAGDPTLRNFSVGYTDTEASRRQQGVGFNCLNYAAPAEGFAQLRALPDMATMETCLNGIRSDIVFPSCWNGELDSADHKSHVAYPTDVEDGTCPDTHPKRLVTMLYETLWDPTPFFGQDGYFVFATGDATGYGYHGDFLNGWLTEPTSGKSYLQLAMEDETCNPPETLATAGVIEQCAVFNSTTMFPEYPDSMLQTDEQMGSCTIDQAAKGNFTAPGPTFPGCNSISFGPAPAVECGSEGSSSPDTSVAAPVVAPKPSKVAGAESTHSLSIPEAAVPSTSSSASVSPASVSPASVSPVSVSPASVSPVSVSPASVSPVVTTSAENFIVLAPTTTAYASSSNVGSKAVKNGENVDGVHYVIDVITVTSTYTDYVQKAKRTAAAEPEAAFNLRRHAQAHRNRRSRWA